MLTSHSQGYGGTHIGILVGHVLKPIRFPWSWYQRSKALTSCHHVFIYVSRSRLAFWLRWCVGVTRVATREHPLHAHPRRGQPPANALRCRVSNLGGRYPARPYSGLHVIAEFWQAIERYCTVHGTYCSPRPRARPPYHHHYSIDAIVLTTWCYSHMPYSTWYLLQSMTGSLHQHSVMQCAIVLTTLCL